MAVGHIRWLFLAVWCISKTVCAQVVLNEVLSDPLGSEHHDEYVELLNISQTHGVDLSGWQLGDANELDMLVDIGMGRMLQPGQFAVVLDGSYFGNSTTYTGLADDVLVLQIADRSFGRSGWSNSNEEEIILRDATGDTVETFRYWPEKRPGYSWEKVDPAATQWKLSRVVNGTPGRINSVYELHQFEGRGMEIELIPNPFSEQLTLHFKLVAAPALLTAWIYDVQGHRVRKLATSAEVGPSGRVLWDGRDHTGRPVDAGMYVVYLEVSTEGVVERLKKVVVRQD